MRLVVFSLNNAGYILLLMPHRVVSLLCSNTSAIGTTDSGKPPSWRTRISDG
jgi:hypothetical protein